MLYLKWIFLGLVDILLTPSLLVVPPLIALFTKEMHYTDNSSYTWGWIWGTYDNPPQGDEGFVAKRSIFPNVTTGWKGYVNRVQWMWRNNLYGFAKHAGVRFEDNLKFKTFGNLDISDKQKVPGWYFAKVFKGERIVAFEFYAVLPYNETRNLRVRLGWKVMTDKFKRYGFAQFVMTINPFDGYGDD